MRTVLQTEATECGLASMTMVAQFHGHKLDLNAIRQRFGLSLKGAGLRDLMNMMYPVVDGAISKAFANALADRLAAIERL